MKRAALLYMISLGVFAATACGRTGFVTVGTQDAESDAEAELDAEPEPEPEVVEEDIEEEEAPPELPEGACDIICTFLAEECGISLPMGSCPAVCPRLSEDILWCLLEAAENHDCDAVSACFEDAPPVEECDPVCEFANDCFFVPVGICEDGCRLMNEDVLECMEEAMERDDCSWLYNCLLYPGGDTQRCEEVCEFIIETCGYDLGIDVAMCTIGCQMGIVEGLLLDCAGVAAAVGSCNMLALCLAIAPPELP